MTEAISAEQKAAPISDSWTRIRTTPWRLLLLMSLGMLGLHGIIWSFVVWKQDIPWSQMLTAWDSGWYVQIVQSGYAGQAWAFYPAWPMLLKGLSNGFGIMLHPALLGSLIATVLFGVILYLWQDMAQQGARYEDEALVPGNSWGWFLFVFSPASFAFHSNHTESLYLLLSLLAFRACVSRQWLGAAVACGLAALTKNQGVLLAVSCALWMASLHRSWGRRILTFGLFGMISGAFFACFPLYQWFETGDALRFIHVQDLWHPDISVVGYLKGLVALNSWQAWKMGTLIHHLFFVMLLAGAILVWSYNRFISLYLLLFILIEPLSGELVGTLRYGTVLAPAFFALGNRVTDKTLRRWPLLYGFALVWILLNCAVTWNYAIARWAY